ncbi:MAG TPA: hypothetical protein VFG65_04985 [Fimbriimonadales bacterium]|jgi:DNA-directed RNA polymerase subunit RPC12/RpoP|nr:hypothetical protein [Fimbriimonadales bacterium]
MPKCSICGAEIDRMPNWLNDVDIVFRCAKCSAAVPIMEAEEVHKEAPAAVEEHEAEEEHEDEEPEPEHEHAEEE